MLSLQINMLRDECCAVAAQLMKRKTLDEVELEDCARLYDALAEAYRILRHTVAKVTLARLRRKSRTRQQ